MKRLGVKQTSGEYFETLTRCTFIMFFAVSYISAELYPSAPHQLLPLWTHFYIRADSLCSSPFLKIFFLQTEDLLYNICDAKHMSEATQLNEQTTFRLNSLSFATPAVSLFPPQNMFTLTGCAHKYV